MNLYWLINGYTYNKNQPGKRTCVRTLPLKNRCGEKKRSYL